ncbi:MAG: 1-(5-phosphoribosyl)-5-[(5-phosphoribosylamino)methylideneamino] imidazole-4-carboxamide isomerase [Nitrososphaerota archaeon]|nr:1-(5-phosphoribosyl)-5-[(5-phosphoribosylamino)methylideneamino] imidazole-4-carboxamide isomerase [Candidatus Calditenuaceae archaeon]MDW8073269.1 1-(5-phosphoribosyl)-5-[(5-phosphoribosylamino)methylideneamino] imidazole-4-carboxamide isomerase [Nitrososphaerota archaeon]
MELWVSIDLLEGRVVRLIKGDLGNMFVYSNNPAYVAKQLASTEIDGIHVVDIDAALNRGSNMEVIKEIVKNAKGKTVQVGGGLRTKERVEKVFETGVDRIVIGTILFKDKALVQELVNNYGPDRLIAALDFNNEGIVYEGWSMTSLMRLEEGFRLVDDLSLKLVLMTAVERDGTLAGPDIRFFQKIPAERRSHVYASGGITTPREVKMLSGIGYRGIILGRAYYEKLAPIKDYIKAAKGVSSVS